MAMIKAQGFTCPIYVQGRDFEVFGWPGRFLPVFCVFVLAIGGVVLLRRPAKHHLGTTDALQSQKMQRWERTANRVFATIMALAMIGAGLLLLLMTTAHWGKAISGTEAESLISQHKNARLDVYQFDDGTKELWITLPGNRTYPGYIAPADESTLARLAEHNISCKTYVQGRDFGFRGPGHWLSLSGSFFLTAGAVLILWRVTRKNRLNPA
jgi:hypothetical protein